MTDPRTPAEYLPDDLVQCATCAVEYDARDLPPLCPICADERQYLPSDGVQRWMRPAEFAGRIDLVEREPDLFGLVVRADDGQDVGIDQQAKIVRTAHGTVMVDVPAAITAEAVSAVRELGPMRAIVPSHPHMFGPASAWSRALGDVDVWVAAADEGRLGRRPDALRLWEGRVALVPGVTAWQPGGHFPGSTVVHWPGADGRGVLLAGDTIAVNPDRRTVAFMRSYPNRIPLSAAVVERIAADVGTVEFDRLYSNFEPRIAAGAREAVASSARRHAAWVRGEHDDLTGGSSSTPAAPERIGPATPLRIVHLVADLAAAETFWVGGVGLDVRYRKAARPSVHGADGTDGEPALLMVGPAGATWHLELVEAGHAPDGARPGGTDDGSVVLYLGADPDPRWLARIEAHGGRRVDAHVDYWRRWGVTVEAPSGHRLVLSTRRWDA